LTAVAILAVLDVVVVAKSFVPVTAETTRQTAAIAPACVPSAVLSPGMMAIVPASALDRTAEAFIGTGDASNGTWVRP
jgi:hypothetical protein